MTTKLIYKQKRQKQQKHMPFNYCFHGKLKHTQANSLAFLYFVVALFIYYCCCFFNIYIYIVFLHNTCLFNCYMLRHLNSSETLQQTIMYMCPASATAAPRRMSNHCVRVKTPLFMCQSNEVKLHVIRVFCSYL